ncbi:hypothetical protein [Pinibacter soli]|uniref:Outer membrane protein beta-barrel domain-containing protein n=1 Tax=Pinibacter soli TaxID=3044211 RepID=A0ABT6RB76_9BACT|nr:hypothetical protein [Pinibacter soli]MDI3319671.1 hypothetical protein [Pinibacter soli]
MNRILLAIALLTSFFSLNAQNRGLWQVGAYTNVLAFNPKANNGNFIRAVSTGAEDAISSNAFQWSVGGSVERALNKRLFVSSGISFSQFQTSTFNQSGIGSYPFYALVNKNQNQVEYASVDRIYTVRKYLGVPLEVRFEPPHPKNGAFYLKASITTQFAVGKSLTEITMSDSSAYSGSISLPKHYDNTRDVFCSGYAGMGFRIGRLEHLNGRMEVGVPVPFTSTAGAYRLRAGIMASGTLYYPLSKKIKHSK